MKYGTLPYEEGWMSGLNQRFTKPPAFTGPRVRISLPPPR